ncbi:MAG: acetyl-CoA C-acyltransferase, partial [Acidimicrobiia bacterium]
MSERVAIVGGARTPFAKAGTFLKERTALELGTHSVDGALAKLDLDPDTVDQLVYGIVAVDARVPHLAREVNFASSLPDSVRSVTVTDNCITSVTAIEAVHDAISAGRSKVGIAGGVESMSNPSVLWSRNATRVLSDFQGARTAKDKAVTLARLRRGDFVPRPPGVNEPSTGMSMGEHTEITVKEWGISRSEQDEIAYASHMNAAAATDDGRLTAEIHPLDDIAADTMVRPGTSMEKLAKLPPVFDPTPEGTLTAGNSSPLTDGAASVVLMAESAVAELGHEPLAFIRAIEFAAISPDDGLLMGPGIAVPRMLARAGVALEDIDIIEMHEAFGGQVAANLAAWEHGWKEDPIGKVDRD